MKAHYLIFVGLLGLLLTFQGVLTAHANHHAKVEQIGQIGTENDSSTKIIEWLGQFHPVFLHFPITLIVMTVISEWLYWKYGNPLFDQASRFMIIAAAIAIIPTVLSGLAFGYEISYDSALANLFWWHRLLGLFTACLTIATAILRELGWLKAYYACLTIIFISVNLTAYLGGEMTFGPGHLLPPIN